MSEAGPERRLAAILVADVVGYSRLIGRDEAATLSTFGRHREELIEPTAIRHNGIIVKWMGDGMLMEFASVVAAVSFATELQTAMRERNQDTPQDQQIIFRIGINLGDVVHENNDVYGDGVNVASRIEALATPGGICISGAVFDQISGGTDQKFDEMGYKKLKNIAQPVRVYETRFTEPRVDVETNIGFPYSAGIQKRQPMASGGCLCGKVRYEVWAEPLGVGYCHCRFCQLAVGAPLTDWVCFEEKFVSFPGEAPKIYRSSPINERAFCGNCGTSLFSYFNDAAETPTFFYVIRLSTMDSPKDYPPTSHACTENLLPWMNIIDDLPRTHTGDDIGLSTRWTAVGQPKNGIALGTAKERLYSTPKD